MSIIYSSMDALADSLAALEKRFGPVQFETMEIETIRGDHYKEEMGDGLLRRFFSFEREVVRSTLPDLKVGCLKVEAQFSDHVGDYFFRTVNLDPGILSSENLVMAHHRELNHRIYIKDGVFAEIPLIFSRGRFVRLPWTDPDYYCEESINFFQRTRDLFELVEQVHSEA